MIQYAQLSPVNSGDKIQSTANSETACSNGWKASLSLEFAVKRDKTRLVKRQQFGPLAIQRTFHPEGPVCHSYLLHPPGGVVGGDQLKIQCTVAENAHALVTTPGASKFYQTHLEQPLIARQTQQLSVSQNAILEWLPQEAIFFSGAHVEQQTRIDIDSNGKFIGWDIQCLGRPAINDRFESGNLFSCSRVYIDGKLILVEQFSNQQSQMLNAACGLRGFPMHACMLAAPATEKELEQVQQLISNQTQFNSEIGVTLVDQVLVVRMLGQQTEPMLQQLTEIWSELRKSWLDVPAHIPRIWNT